LRGDGVGFDAKILAIHHWVKVSRRCRAPPAPMHGHLCAGKAFLVATIDVGDDWKAGLRGCCEYSV